LFSICVLQNCSTKLHSSNIFGHLVQSVVIYVVYFSHFGMFGPSKIWQPWSLCSQQQGCQIVLSTIYQYREKCAKLPQNRLNVHEIHQHLPLQGPPKFTQIENKPSGNPAQETKGRTYMRSFSSIDLQPTDLGSDGSLQAGWPEFSSIGLLLPFWHFLKITKVAHYFGLRFSAVQVNFYKTFVGLFYWRLL
jgi:hypothetical protein